jgi:hypothetical protein
MIVKFYNSRNEFGNFNRKWVSDSFIEYESVLSIVKIIKEHFPENISLWYLGCDNISIVFYNKEDNDYFKVLASGGFEI